MHGEVLEGKEREGGNVNFYGFIMITFSKLLFFFLNFITILSTLVYDVELVL